MKKAVDHCDFLLLNASNMTEAPIFPYAFVQVSAVARRFGISVRSHDFVFDPPHSWQRKLDRLLSVHHPRLIGITLRQTDSLFVQDYKNGDSEFWPIEATYFLIRQIRELTKIPIVIGGFGFSCDPRGIIEYLQTEYGVVGDPEPLFENFNKIVSREGLENICNLVYKDKGHYCFTKRAFFAPSQTPEYNENIAQEISSFYQRSIPWLSRIVLTRLPQIAIEVARGCPNLCYFCTEPIVKGAKERRRDLDVVFRDVDFMLRQGFRSFFFICDEANADNNDLLKEIAGKMIERRQKRTWLPLPTWTAYFIQKDMSRDFMKLLEDSGMEWAYNDIQSCHPSNICDTQVPYTTEAALQFLSDFIGHTDQMLLNELIAVISRKSLLGQRLRSAQGELFNGGLFTEESWLLKVLAFYYHSCRQSKIHQWLYRLTNLDRQGAGISVSAEVATKIVDVFGLLPLVLIKPLLQSCQQSKIHQWLYWLTKIPYVSNLRLHLMTDAASRLTQRLTLGTFIGNLFSTPETYRLTAKMLGDLGLANRYYFSTTVHATRAFPAMRRFRVAAEKSRETVFPQGNIFPGREKAGATFLFNDVRNFFSNREDFLKFNDYVVQTFFSRQHLLTKNWSRFLAETTTVALFGQWLEYSLPRVSDIPYLRIDHPDLGFVIRPLRQILKRPINLQQLELFFYPSTVGLQGIYLDDLIRTTFVPFALVEIVYRAHIKKLGAIFDYLKIPRGPSDDVYLSEFEVTRLLYQRYDNIPAVVKDVASACKLDLESVEIFCLRKFLFHKNVVLRPDYKAVLFEGAGSSPAAEAP
ncbi:MAG: hypothetical protein ACXVI1_10705 [Halobacteriota archaeon]